MAQRVKNKPELKIVVSNTPEAPAVEPVPEQVEMPFAIVNGEPVTQMPKDLYIPPQAMEVFLEAFEGPLDLLLYLIRRQNLNILDIPLAEITRQYMKYIEVMTELQLELAGEYMVMAATLAEIKSRMLLPRPKVDPEGREEDPRAELVRRLQEYERFKRAAEDIDSLPRLERDVWTTSADLKDRSVVKLLPTVTLQEMLLAFKDVVVRSEMFAHHHISRERLSVRERMSDVLTRLEQASFVEFVRLFRLEEGRMGVTVTFMALLELVREGLIEIVQAVPFAPLHVRAAGASRKLHVVGGNEPLADGTVVDATTAVVVAETVFGDVPTVELLLPGDAGLESIVEQVLDPNFVDEDFDEEDALLEGVDDGVGRIAAPAAPAAPEPEVGSPEPEVGLAEPAVELAEPAVELADVGLTAADAVAVAVESVLDAGPVEVSPQTIGVEQDVVFAQQTSAYEVVVAEFAEAPSGPSDTVVGSTTELDEAGAVVEPVSASVEPTAALSEPSAEVVETSADNEVAVTVDPAVFDTPIGTAEPDAPADTSLDEPLAAGVEYESLEEAVAAGEQPAVDEDVSLIGDTLVAGEVSLVGDESLSGGPALEVEEFAFDELPALDDAEPADQQPAAGAEAVVNKVPGTDEPSSPGEEADD
jgi:chromatin segregation and condensation protein Rec8/ScpA/Scc1 (kleisin family)